MRFTVVSSSSAFKGRECLNYANLNSYSVLPTTFLCASFVCPCVEVALTWRDVLDDLAVADKLDEKSEVNGDDHDTEAQAKAKAEVDDAKAKADAKASAEAEADKAEAKAEEVAEEKAKAAAKARDEAEKEAREAAKAAAEALQTAEERKKGTFFTLPRLLPSRNIPFCR